MARSFSITLDEFKGGFVNRRVMRDLVRSKRRAWLQAAGEEIRRGVSRSLKKAKKLTLDAASRRERNIPPRVPLYKPNPAPIFPNVRVAKNSNSLRDISKPMWLLDNKESPSRVSIGPPKLQSNPVPALLERGGTVATKSRRSVRRIGGGGEIRVDAGRYSKKTGKRRFGKRSPSMVRATPDDGPYVRVVYIKLRTQAQVARSQEINNRLYKPSRMIRVQGRRYMQTISGRVMKSGVVEKKHRRLFKAFTESMPKVPRSVSKGLSSISIQQRRAA